MIKTALKRENIPLLFFYIAYAIELAILLIDKSAYVNPIEGRLFQLTFVLCTLKVVMTKYTNKEWALMVAFLALGAVSYFSTERNEIVRIVMFVAASKGIDIKKLLKATFYVTLIGVLLLMILSLTGVLGWNYVEADFDGDGPEGLVRRYCFGLGHPNALHCMFFCILLLVTLVYWKKLNEKYCFGVFIGNLILYYFTESKTGVLIVCLYILLIMGYKFIKKDVLCSMLSFCIGGILIVGIIFSIIVAMYGFGYNLPIFEWVDRYLTGRVWTACAYGGVKFWSLFSVASNTNFFDMGFVRLFYWYGIIPTVSYLFVLFVYLKYLYKKQIWSDFLVVSVILIYTLVEAHFVSVYVARNYIIILLFGCWNEVFHVTDGKEKYIYQLIGRKNMQAES